VLVLLDPAHRLSVADVAPYLLVVAAYNLIITVLLAVRFFPRFVPPLALIADILSTIVLLYLAGNALDIFFFFPLFPIVVATLRFGPQAGLLTAGIFAASYGLLAVVVRQLVEAPSQIFQIGLYILLFFLAAVVLAVMPVVTPAARGQFAGKQTAAERGAVPDNLRMIYEMASAMSATMNYERVLDAILDISRLGLADLGERMGESVGMVLLYDQGGLFPASHRNLVVKGDETQHIGGQTGSSGRPSLPGRQSSARMSLPIQN